MGELKFAISKAGYNITTTLPPYRLIFDSIYPSLRYYTSGSVQRTQGSSYMNWTYGETTVAHNLGYRPFVLVYVKSNMDTVDSYGTEWDLSKLMPFSLFGQYYTSWHGREGIMIASLWVDSTYLRFRTGVYWDFSNSRSVDFTFYYKVFKNKAFD